MVRGKIRIFHNLARSGGTLVSRCIGAMENIALLSEIHPVGRTNRHFNAVRQYQEWYRDVGIADWRTAPFDRSLDKIWDDCAAHKQHLVIRDWAHIDFLGPPSPKPPTGRLMLDDRLDERYEILHCALVRHPAETWRSTSKMAVIQNANITEEIFFKAYRDYLNVVENFPIIRYEDFTEQPVSSMQEICSHLEIPFDPGFQDRWADYTRVTGDMHKNSRGSGKRQISHFEIAPLNPEQTDRYQSDPYYQFIVNTLKYPF